MNASTTHKLKPLVSFNNVEDGSGVFVLKNILLKFSGLSFEDDSIPAQETVSKDAWLYGRKYMTESFFIKNLYAAGCRTF